MRLHQDIDRRSLILAREIVERIDRDPLRHGLLRAKQTCARWRATAPCPALDEWAGLLARPWSEVRAILLQNNEEGRRLRQSSPFTSVLQPRERWAIYRNFAHESPAA